MTDYRRPYRNSFCEMSVLGQAPAGNDSSLDSNEESDVLSSTDRDILNSYPKNSTFFSTGVVTMLWVLFILLAVATAGFATWASIREYQKRECKDQVDHLEGVETSMRIRYVREYLEVNKCINFCNTTSCDSCCAACDGDSAPEPLPQGHPNKPPAIKNDMCNNKYASFVSTPPTTVCRFGPLSVHICGFLNDATLSVVEVPHTLSMGFNEGTILASVPRKSLSSGYLCKSSNAFTGPDGPTRIVVRGDQTGFTLSFDTVVSATSGGCLPIFCPYLS